MSLRASSSGPFASSSDLSNASAVAGATVTAALDALQTALAPLALAPLRSFLGWAPTGGTQSQQLILLAAGHAAGLYEIDYATIIRTVATGNFDVVLNWKSPGFGVEQKFLQTVSIASLGTVIQSVGTVPGAKGVPIVSDGTQQIDMNWNSSGLVGLPVLDLYGSARLVAA